MRMYYNNEKNMTYFSSGGKNFMFKGHIQNADIENLTQVLGLMNITITPEIEVYPVTQPEIKVSDLAQLALEASLVDVTKKINNKGIFRALEIFTKKQTTSQVIMVSFERKQMDLAIEFAEKTIRQTVRRLEDIGVAQLETSVQMTYLASDKEEVPETALLHMTVKYTTYSDPKGIISSLVVNSFPSQREDITHFIKWL